MTPLVSTLMLFSVLVPSKLWFAPGASMPVDVNADRPVTLRLTDFENRPVDATAGTRVETPRTVDLAQLYPGLAGGTYLLYAMPDGDKPGFVGTPLVVQAREDKRPGGAAGTVVTRVEPLRYAVMDTDAGPMTLAFYYDVAPNTVANFLRLSEEGYYDGIGFHRIVPGFVLQAGDPLGLDPARAGTGGPGYTIMQEFNRRPHSRGVLSMARQGDEGEARGGPPGPVAANSASSQFFVCLDYDRTSRLDGKYTVFGRVTAGEETMRKLEATPAGRGDRPVQLPRIKTITVKPVTPGDNPYDVLLAEKK